MIELRGMTELTPAHWDLLLDADPQQDTVSDYLKRSTVIEARQAGELVGVMVLLPTRPLTLEIVNIAVKLEYRGRGIATQLLAEALVRARQGNYKTLEIGTGSTGVEQLYLYQKVGFRMTSIDRDFFLRHYEEEIIENGLVLKDMVRLSQEV